MNFKIFIKEKIYSISYVILTMTIVNIFLVCEEIFFKEIKNIVYLNVIVIVLYIIYITLDYMKWKKCFLNVYKKILNDEEIYKEEIKEEDFSSNLIKQIIINKESNFNLRYDNLMDKLVELDEYIAKSIHELKLPIATLNMIIDRIEDFKVEKELKFQVEKIRFLTNSILYGSRSTCLFEDLFIKEEKLEMLVKKSIKNNSFFLIENNIELSLDNLDFIVNTDSKWICYVLDQIISNSIKYSKENGKLKFYAIEDSKVTVLHIKDNGIGIEKQDLERVFNKGFTGINGRNRLYKSTGMGLYFSKKILNSLGHDIKVESQKNKYSDFQIYFPKMSDYLNVTKK